MSKITAYHRLCNVRKVSFDPWVVTIGRLGRCLGAGGGDGNVYKGRACRCHMQGAGLLFILFVFEQLHE